jgi:hypothetical protein
MTNDTFSTGEGQRIAGYLESRGVSHYMVGRWSVSFWLCGQRRNVSSVDEAVIALTKLQAQAA